MITDYIINFLIFHLLIGFTISVVYMTGSCRDGPSLRTGLILLLLWGVAIPYWVVKICIFEPPKNKSGGSQ